jgi:hypothetical protein
MILYNFGSLSVFLTCMRSSMSKSKKKTRNVSECRVEKPCFVDELTVPKHFWWDTIFCNIHN